MKNLISFIIILFSLLLNSCTTDTTLSPNNDSSQGGISLNIDRLHKPDNVVSVTAYLTRVGYDTVSGSLNLLSDTTADITLNDIAAGEWHLRVDAFDEDTVVVYSGEKDITILAEITTEVTLVLQPTGVGTGSIYIYVTWGVPPNTDWVDYSNNPIFRVNQIPYFTLAVSQAQVMYDENKYKMWFMNTYNNGHSDISYAESSDGYSWQLASPNPILTVGSDGNWDSYAVGMGYVFKENGVYKLYYVGTNGHPMYTMRQIGLATSTDGINWSKHTDPVFLANNSEYFLGVHSIVKIDNTYYMYYDSSPSYQYVFNINLATSTDGINWTRYTGNPILYPDQYWENGSIRNPSIVKENNGYRMIYGNGNQNAVGTAISADGIVWNKEQSNSIFNLSDIHNNWTSNISYPFCAKIGNQYRLYYTGTDFNQLMHLGVATRY
jgi:predicted GH43/DUF377 family glycosyl hydrolase